MEAKWKLCEELRRQIDHFEKHLKCTRELQNNVGFETASLEETGILDFFLQSEQKIAFCCWSHTNNLELFFVWFLLWWPPAIH